MALSAAVGCFQISSEVERRYPGKKRMEEGREEQEDRKQIHRSSSSSQTSLRTGYRLCFSYVWIAKNKDSNSKNDTGKLENTQRDTWVCHNYKKKTTSIAGQSFARHGTRNESHNLFTDTGSPPKSSQRVLTQRETPMNFHYDLSVSLGVILPFNKKQMSQEQSATILLSFVPVWASWLFLSHNQTRSTQRLLTSGKEVCAKKYLAMLI